MGRITVILGAQWGDEGKGKLCDILSFKSDICARCSGGHNAGHTIKVGETVYDFHILPSGLVNPSSINLIGSACVVHVPSFLKELSTLRDKGLDTKDRIFISDRAQVVFDLHTVIDGLEEEELKQGALAVNGTAKANSGAIGTTRKGIGPAYSTKAARSGVRIHQIFDKETMDRRLRTMAKAVEKRYGQLATYDVDEEIKRFDDYREILRPLVVDSVPMMTDAQTEGANILVEAAQALMLDIDYGTYPYVTSSSTGIAGVFSGLALNPMKITDIIGVVKAYTTRVGSGPFPTEQLNEDGEKLQKIGREFGVTTGRKRRCGWLDLVVVKYSANVNHYTSFCLTKLDILDSFSKIQVAVAYYDKASGKDLESFPADLDVLEACGVRYEELPGWESETTGITEFADLPTNAKRYIEFIEKEVGVKVGYVGTGPGRDNLIVR